MNFFYGKFVSIDFEKSTAFFGEIKINVSQINPKLLLNVLLLYCVINPSPQIDSFSWIWKGVSATSQSGWYTLAYQGGQIVFHNFYIIGTHSNNILTSRWISERSPVYVRVSQMSEGQLVKNGSNHRFCFLLKHNKSKVFIIRITPKTNQHMCRVWSFL